MRWLLACRFFAQLPKRSRGQTTCPDGKSTRSSGCGTNGKMVDAASPPSPAIADDSVYQLAMTLVDQGWTDPHAGFVSGKAHHREHVLRALSECMSAAHTQDPEPGRKI